MSLFQSKKTINLALQGGGSHGAFTWGVLDRLLEDDKRLKIEGLSGASAGAMNAAVLLQGYAKGGADGARRALDQFWVRVSTLGREGMPPSPPIEQMLSSLNIDMPPMSDVFKVVQQMVSPYRVNPLNINPLRELLEEILDIKALRACTAIKLFVTATNVETGRPRVFSREEISIDALMASACLPFTYQAVEIDGVPYWDGGFTGNPSLFPLIEQGESSDLVVVRINPLRRPGTPEMAADILSRMNEIGFSAPLMNELRALALVQELFKDVSVKRNEKAAPFKNARMHMIAAEEEMRPLGAASKTNADIDFLLRLKILGRKTADAWLARNWDAIGKRSSVDIREMYFGR